MSNANPYSTDANMFVAPAVGDQGAADSAPPPPVNPHAAPAAAADAFDPFGMDAFAAPAAAAPPVAGSSGTGGYSPPLIDPFAGTAVGGDAGAGGSPKQADVGNPWATTTTQADYTMDAFVDMPSTAAPATAQPQAYEPPPNPYGPGTSLGGGDLRMTVGDRSGVPNVVIGRPPHDNDSIFTSPSGAAATHRDGLLEGQAAGTGAADTSNVGKGGMCSLNYYQQYFDVDTDDVVRRLRSSLTFQESDFLKAAGEPGAKAPDLYGTVWVSTTLWVILAVCSVIEAKFDLMLKDPTAAATPVPLPIATPTPGSGGDLPVVPAPAGAVVPAASSSLDETWLFDFEWVVIGIGTVYGYVFLGSLISWAILKCNDVKRFKLTQLLCLFGYGLAPLVAGTLLTIIPVHAVKLTAIFLTSIYSLATIAHHIYPHTTEFSHHWKVGFYGAMVLGHAVATFLLFFQIIWLDH